MLLSFDPQISQIDVAILETRDGHDLESRHDRACRIGPVGRSRNETNVAMSFATGTVVFTNRQEPGIFALGAGIRLKCNRSEAGDFSKPTGQLITHFAVANCL